MRNRVAAWYWFLSLLTAFGGGFVMSLMVIFAEYCRGKMVGRPYPLTEQERTMFPILLGLGVTASYFPSINMIYRKKWRFLGLLVPFCSMAGMVGGETLINDLSLRQFNFFLVIELVGLLFAVIFMLRNQESWSEKTEVAS